jgi:transcriptional regulator with XRE-family HTH domain
VLRIKFRRIELNLTQRAVARKAKMFPQVLSDIERGRSNPTPDELTALAKILGESNPVRLMVHVSGAPLGDGAKARAAAQESANG